MNDPPDSTALGQLADPARLSLHDALTSPTETQRAPNETPPPASAAWTERFKEPGKPASRTLIDQVWLRSALAPKVGASRVSYFVLIRISRFVM
jgi:hypothetical protein